MALRKLGFINYQYGSKSGLLTKTSGPPKRNFKDVMVQVKKTTELELVAQACTNHMYYGLEVRFWEDA